jgi:hypothetical protein
MLTCWRFSNDYRSTLGNQTRHPIEVVAMCSRRRILVWALPNLVDAYLYVVLFWLDSGNCRGRDDHR